MSKLTSGRLKEIANNERIPVTDPEMGDMAHELLTLREATAPKMAEVDALESGLLDVLQTITDRYAIGVAGIEATRRAKAVVAALHTAILACEREKQRADEAEEELERWKRRADWLGTCYKDKTTAAGRIVIVLDGTKSATYPDDAEVIAGMIDKAMEDSDGLADGLQSTKDRIVSLTAELSYLKSAPKLEEIEVLVQKFAEEKLFEHKNTFLKTVDIAKQAIISRNEMFELLKWIRSWVNNDRFMDEVYEGTDPARRINEIVEGK